jgi:hypothetical protein
MRERERGSAREVRGVVIFLVVQDGTGRGSRERECSGSLRRENKNNNNNSPLLRACGIMERILQCAEMGDAWAKDRKASTLLVGRRSADI